MKLWPAMLLLLAGCLDRQVSYLHKSCPADQPWCPEGLVCNPNTRTCETSATCHGGSSGTTGSTCAGSDLYLAPGGTGSGADPDHPRADLSGASLQPGDRVHLLAGSYSAPLQIAASGSFDCPVELSGPAAFAAKLGAPLTLSGSHWRIHDLAFEVRGQVAAVRSSGPSVNVGLSQLRFRNTGADVGGASGQIFDIYVDQGWQSWTIDGCDFESPKGGAVFVDPGGTGLIFRNSRVASDYFGPTLQLEAKGAEIEGNDFSGAVESVVVLFASGSASDGHARRNVFHDLTNAGVLAVSRADEVVSNTFLRFATGGASPSRAADRGVFRDNIVSQVDEGMSGTATDAGYNLFDQVTTPYASDALAATDVRGAALLDSQFVPQAGSAAIDAADPALPVLPGGGTRADIGARERGALPADGGVCGP